jgi:hypothetical protein
MVDFARDDQAVVPQGNVDSAGAVVDHRDRDDLRKTVDVGVPLVAERTGIAMQEPGGLERGDLGIECGDVVNEAVGLIDQTGDLRVRRRPQ